MNELGEPQEFLDITIGRNKEKRTITLNPEKYINKILIKFKFNEMNHQRTPMVTTQVANRERKKGKKITKVFCKK